MKCKKIIICIILFVASLVVMPFGRLAASAQKPQNLELGGETTISEGVYTVKNGCVKSKEEYNGYILTLKLKVSEESSFLFEFGDYSLSFSVAGVVADGFTLLENTFSYLELEKECVLRIEAFGTEFSMGLYNDGALEEIYDNVLVGTLPVTLQQCQVTFSCTQGEIYIRDFNGYTLNSSVEIETENYDKEKEESYNQLVVKPEKDSATTNEGEIGNGCAGCSGSIYSVSSGFVLAIVFAFALRNYGRKQE